MINDLQYKRWATQTADDRARRGYGKVPVADYKLTSTIAVEDITPPLQSANSAAPTSTASARGVFSFCMCPGGQIVPTSMDKAHVCVNGMSFSKRSSK